MLEGQAHELFTMLMANSSVNFYGQRVWYNLPYEELSEHKELCNGDLIFQKMCNPAMWTKAVDVFMVIDGFASIDVVGNWQENMTASNDDVCGNEYGNESGNEDVNDDGAEQFSEEAQVERKVAGFVDEEENDDYLNTSPGSDGKVEAVQYFRFKKGSGELRLKKVFASIYEFKEAIVEYVLKE